MVRLHHQPQPSDIFVGVDWGGTHHQLCLVDADGQVLQQRRIPHTVVGLDELCRLLTSPQGLVRVAIERGEGLLVERLLNLNEVEVFCVSPKISARARVLNRCFGKRVCNDRM